MVQDHDILRYRLAGPSVLSLMALTEEEHCLSPAPTWEADWHDPLLTCCMPEATPIHTPIILIQAEIARKGRTMLTLRGICEDDHSRRTPYDSSEVDASWSSPAIDVLIPAEGAYGFYVIPYRWVPIQNADMAPMPVRALITRVDTLQFEHVSPPGSHLRVTALLPCDPRWNAFASLFS